MINRRRLRRLFAPTEGLRRSVLVTFIGFVLFAVGFALSFKVVLLPVLQTLTDWWSSAMRVFVRPEEMDTANHMIAGALLLLGFYLMFSGVRSLLRRVVESMNPGMKTGMVDYYMRKQMLARGPRIVALGGGTGLSTLLRGLKQHSSNITAIVTVTDDGGSSGRLVQELGILPPGDLRNCLVALADAEKLMTDLFQHRFKNASGSLSGHSIGNLLIAGLVEQSGGDVEQALARASEVLAIRGRVVPSTLTPVRLRALLENDVEICGETNIVQSGLRIRRLYLDPEEPEPYPAAIEAIREADLICLGPGSVYTSIIPNLLVPGIAQAIEESKAVKTYICNVMTQPGESDAFTAAEHLVAVSANVEHKVCEYVLVNTGVPSPGTLDKYRESGQYLVEPDVDRIRAMGYKVVAGNFMSESDYVRHDPLRVAARLMEVLSK